MKERFIIFWNTVSLKKAFGFVLVVSLLFAIPVIAVLLQREDSFLSLAGDSASTKDTSVDESLIPYPKNPPVIRNVTRFYGKPGDSVLIYGSNFGEVRKESNILLNNKSIDSDFITYWSDEELEFTMPNQPGIYTVSLGINGNTVSWFGKLDVYDESTKPVVTYNKNSSHLVVPSDYSAKAFVLNVTNKDLANVTYSKINVPNQFTDPNAATNLIYLEVFRGTKPIPFQLVIQ